YLEDFRLFDWEVRSSGKLEEALEFVNRCKDIEVVIVDEAHRFRNQDTRSYELLKNICRDKIVILLTATPFNNRPSDIFSLIKLFVTPRKSTITLENNLELLFSMYKSKFDKLSYIKRYHDSKDREKRNRATTFYKYLFGTENIDIRRVNAETHKLAKQIRDVIEPVTIRRNRIDLQKNPYYKDEVQHLSIVKDPIEWFYELTPKQLQFYDTIIEHYFVEDDVEAFKGSIYRPFIYEVGELEINDDNDVNEGLLEKNREYQQQKNLFNFMRRLLVKRFESSFGAFKESIKNFKRIHEHVLQFIEKTGGGDPLKGEFILDRQLLEKIYDMDVDEIEQYLQEYETNLQKDVLPKKYKRYKIKTFKYKEKFIDDIKHDIKLFTSILEQLDALDLVNNDPKLDCLIKNVANEFYQNKEKDKNKRKIVIFSEFLDTVCYLKDTLNNKFNNRVLVISGDLSDSKIKEIYKNFDASYQDQKDDYDILLCTDKLSEGFNLNRAGMIVNYDIPWNPVRVIQRLGRINRISKKVFDELYIVNFFPTEKGAEIVKSREIAQNKMFMIHNTLGEDAKIFDEDEEPTPAELYHRLQINPETLEAESFYTRVLNVFESIKAQYPEIIKNIESTPHRVKVSKKSTYDELLVFFKKNRLFVMNYDYSDGSIVETTLEEVVDRIACNIDEKALPIDERFWGAYEKVKVHKDKSSLPKSVLSIQDRAKNKLQFILSNECPEALQPYIPFLKQLKEDLIDYGTLSDYTLRRIANFNIDYNDATKLQELVNEIAALQQELGNDYLHKIKAKEDGLQKEIIIAIENKI
ncbi:MAG TPA: helicase-related protein, partial [Spirochaetota bacterium]|nr:helicase-related protein [Spirochaetota bacterium]